MISGRTYTLTDNQGDPGAYYHLVKDLVERFLEQIPTETDLRERVRHGSSRKGILRFFRRRDRQIGTILDALDKALSPYLTGVEDHLRTLSVSDRFDRTLRTDREQYLLYMIEIELTNRINREVFSNTPWRMALIAHCLRDFRKGCRSRPGDLEEQCAHCDPECHVNRGSRLLERHGVHPYISVSMDHGKLFRSLKDSQPDMGVVGIACVPELVNGMRLCESLGIPAVGVPLDANRCSRWMGECRETTFSLVELEKLLKPSI